MNLRQIDNRFNIDSVSKDDINKFEDYLKGADFLFAPAGEPVKRFLELTFGRRLQTFLTKVPSAKLEPIVIRAYFERHKKDIANIFKNETKFVLELLQLHIMDLVMFLNNDKIVKPMLDEQRKQVQNTNDMPHADAEQVQNVVDSVRNSCQMYGNSLNDMLMYSTGIDQRQMVFADIFWQVVNAFKYIISQLIERDITINRRDATISEKDTVIIQKDTKIMEKDRLINEMSEQINALNRKTNEQMSVLNDQLSDANIRASEYIKEIYEKQQKLEKQENALIERERQLTESQESLEKQKKENEEQKQKLEKQANDLIERDRQLKELQESLEKQKKENEEQKQKLKKQEDDLIGKESQLKEAEEELKRKQEQFNKANANTSEANANTDEANNTVKVLSEKLKRYQNTLKQVIGVNTELNKKIELLEKGNSLHQ